MNRSILRILPLILLPFALDASSEDTLPDGAFMPSFRNHRVNDSMENPFICPEETASQEKQQSHLRKVENLIKSQIAGFLEGEYLEEGSLLLKNGKRLLAGKEIQLNTKEEEEPISLVYQGIENNIALFDLAGQKLQISVNKESNKYAFKIEERLTTGVVIHPEGWTIAPIGNLKDKDDLRVNILGRNYPVQIVSFHPEIDLAILKVFNKNPNKGLPFTPLSDKKLDEGSLLRAQEHLNHYSSLVKQVVKSSENELIRAPEINQSQGAITLNEQNAIVSMMLGESISSEQILSVIGEIPDFDQTQSVDIQNAVIEVIKV